MMDTFKSRKGQAAVPEYVVGFLLVVAAMIAATVYVQRALQARARDAKVYMLDTAAKGCLTAGCQEAAGATAEGKFAYEYEPYYSKINSVVDRDQNQQRLDILTGIFSKQFAQATRVNSTSEQLPPVEAN
ncbi:MAG: hypothetical protein HY591_01495 [Candidatus Omnitrophica bacterium]|nr:hypothetical protein [Candidatus Omnitrophota bacterium]